MMVPMMICLYWCDEDDELNIDDDDDDDFRVAFVIITALVLLTTLGSCYHSKFSSGDGKGIVMLL